MEFEQLDFDIESGEGNGRTVKVFRHLLAWLLEAIKIKASIIGDILTGIYGFVLHWFFWPVLTGLAVTNFPLAVLSSVSLCFVVYLTHNIVVTPIIMCGTGLLGVMGWYSGTIKTRWARIKNSAISQSTVGRVAQYARGIVCAFWGELIILAFVLVTTAYISYKRVKRAFKKEAAPKVENIMADVVYRVCTAMTGVSFLFMLIYGSWKDITQLVAALMGLANWTYKYLSGVASDPDERNFGFPNAVMGRTCPKHIGKGTYSVSEDLATLVNGVFHPSKAVGPANFAQFMQTVRDAATATDSVPDDDCVACWAGFLAYCFVKDGVSERIARARANSFMAAFPESEHGEWNFPGGSAHPGLGSGRESAPPMDEVLDNLENTGTVNERALRYAKRVLNALWQKRYFMLLVASSVLVVSVSVVFVVFYFKKRAMRAQASTPGVSDVTPTGPGRKRDRKKIGDDDGAYATVENPWSDLYYIPDNDRDFDTGVQGATVGDKEEAVTTPKKAADRPPCPTTGCSNRSKKHLRRFRHVDISDDQTPITQTNKEAAVPSSLPVEIDYSKLAFFVERNDKEDLIIASATRVHGVFFSAYHVKEGMPTHLVMFNGSPKWDGVEEKSKFVETCISDCVPVKNLRVFPSKDKRDLIAIAIPTSMSSKGKGYSSGKIARGEQAAVIGYHSSQKKILVATGTITEMKNGMVMGHISTDWGVSGGPWINKSGQVFGIHNGVVDLHRVNCGVLLTEFDMALAKAPPSPKVATPWDKAITGAFTPPAVLASSSPLNLEHPASGGAR